MAAKKINAGADKMGLNPLVNTWLDEEDLDDLLEQGGLDEDEEEEEEEEEEEIEDWDAWVLENMVGETFNLRGVIVDKVVLSTRFSCVSDRCAPGPKAGKWYSCCANAEVGLTESEVDRLAKYHDRLAEYLPAKEPRVRELLWPRVDKDTPFYLDDDGVRLARPSGRCVFSQLDEQGRILCRLWDFAKQQGIDRSDVQPVTCRVFPLVLVKLKDGTPVLSALNQQNYSHIGGNTPEAYPCLCDAKLPPIFESMRDDLDWLLGEGFTDLLVEAAKA